MSTPTSTARSKLGIVLPSTSSAAPLWPTRRRPARRVRRLRSLPLAPARFGPLARAATRRGEAAPGRGLVRPADPRAPGRASRAVRWRSGAGSRRRPRAGPATVRPPPSAAMAASPWPCCWMSARSGTVVEELPITIAPIAERRRTIAGDPDQAAAKQLVPLEGCPVHGKPVQPGTDAPAERQHRAGRRDRTRSGGSLGVISGSGVRPRSRIATTKPTTATTAITRKLVWTPSAKDCGRSWIVSTALAGSSASAEAAASVPARSPWRTACSWPVSVMPASELGEIAQLALRGAR